MIYRDGQLLVKNLQEEVRLGTITRKQYHTICSANPQGRAWFKAILHRRSQATNRFYQLCGELVHKKNQLARVGDEGGNTIIITHLQEELKKLSPGVT